MRRIAALVMVLSVAAVDSALAQKPVNPPPAESAKVAFWSPSRAYLESWVRNVPHDDAARLERLRQMFVVDECEPELQHVKKRRANLICTLPGDTSDTVVIAAHYDYSGKGSGAIENWSGAAMLVLLYHALHATPRHLTYVFAAFDGEPGARTFLSSRVGVRRKQIRAVLSLEDLGMGPARSCTFPDKTDRFAHDLGMEQGLLGLGKQLGDRDMPHAENCNDFLRVDDTAEFRKAGIPALVVHSITRDTISVPFSEQDTPAAIDVSSYDNSFQLLAPYLCLIGRGLDEVFALGEYHSMPEALSATLTRSTRDPDLERALKGTQNLHTSNEASPASVPGAPPEVDVVVTGSDGAPVAGLSRDDFQLSEDGHPRQISSFEEHTSQAADEPITWRTAPPGYFTNVLFGPPPDPPIVLVLDAINTPTRERYFVRRSLLPYLSEIPPGTRLAVFGVASRMWIFQGLASDSKSLLAAVNREMQKTDPAASPAADAPAQSTDGDGQVAAIVEMQKNLASFNEDRTLTPCSPPPPVPRSPGHAPLPATPESLCASSRDTRAQITFDALSQIGRYLEGIPGRKSLVWFAGAFPLPLTPAMLTRVFQDTGNPFPTQRTTEYERRLEDCRDKLTSARISLYPVNSRGAVEMQIPASVTDLAGELKSSAEFYAQLWGDDEDERAYMKSVAEATGGHAFYKTGDLKDALTRATADSSHYYTLTYASTNSAQDGNFRSVEVRVWRPDYTLAYRPGYYASGGRSNSAATAAGSGDTGSAGIDSKDILDQDFANVMVPGLPPAREILFAVRVGLAPEQPSPGSVRYAIDFDTTAPALPDTRNGRLIFAAAAHDADRKQLKALWQRLESDPEPASHARQAATGVHFAMTLDVSIGAATLTAGVYDPQSKKMGTLDLPIVGETSAGK